MKVTAFVGSAHKKHTYSVFPLYAYDIRQMIDSWGKLLDTGCSVFIPSHGSSNSRALVQKGYNNKSNILTA
jgi:hydroxyacylglutathione hydrolase